MQVQFKLEGGLAYLPGLRRTRVIDSDNLSPARTRKLKTLVKTAGFFDLPAVVGSSHPGAADVQRYTITIEDAGKKHTVQAVDPIENDDLSKLVHFIQQQAEQMAESE